MEALKQYIIPYILSNIVFGLSILAAVKKPIVARFFLAAVFLWACCINTSTAINNPGVYLEYAALSPISFYKEFISGFFAKHIAVFVTSVAIGQFLIFTGLLLNGNWVKIACMGGIVFGVAISPLGVGSGFPATVSMSVAFYLLMRKSKHDFIWKLKQYSIVKNN